ncbi:MAG: pyridoxal phosphate-dependent aminotransferase [Phycisphaerae bacterium]
MSRPENCVVTQHLNEHVRGLVPSATVAINDRCNRLMRQGREIFKLGLGQSPFPVPDVVVEALRTHAREKDYLPVQGLERLREAVADHHRRMYHIDCEAEDVLIGPGSKELMFLLQLAYYGELYVPTPTWVSYAPQARIIGRPVHFLATAIKDHWQLTPTQLERLCNHGSLDTRLVILTYPSNPSGTTMSDAHLRELAEIARRYRVVLLSDEIYGKLHHKGQHRSIVPYYPEGTIFSSGLSKWCGAGGWRLGLFIFPRCFRWLRDAMAAVGSETFTSTSAPIQYAAVRAFQGGPELEDYLRRAQRILGSLGAVLTDELRNAGAAVASPDGGFYLFPDFSAFRKQLAKRGIFDSVQMCERLLEETGVAVLPGVAFGQDPTEFTARIAYVDFDAAAALAAAATAEAPLDASFVRQHCNRVVEAVNRVCRWMHAM